MNLPQHLAGIDPAKELEWQLKCNCSRQRVLLFLWCIQAGQANGAWRLNSFLCSNVALSLPKATRHLCGRWEVRSWGNNQGNVCNQPLQRWQGWPAANGPTTHCHLLAPPQEGRHKSGHPEVFSFSFFFKFYFIFKLYIIVLVLPNIKMNPPQVYMCSPSWTLLTLVVLYVFSTGLFFSCFTFLSWHPFPWERDDRWGTRVRNLEGIWQESGEPGNSPAKWKWDH